MLWHGQPAAGAALTGAVTAAGAHRQHPVQAASARDQPAGASGILPATEAAPTAAVDGWTMAARRSEGVPWKERGSPGLRHDLSRPHFIIKDLNASVYWLYDGRG